jgi:hypothetical protein
LSKSRPNRVANDCPALCRPGAMKRATVGVRRSRNR